MLERDYHQGEVNAPDVLVPGLPRDCPDEGRLFVVRLCMSAKPLSSPVAYREGLVHPLNGLTAAAF